MNRELKRGPDCTLWVGYTVAATIPMNRELKHRLHLMITIITLALQPQSQ